MASNSTTEAPAIGRAHSEPDPLVIAELEENLIFQRAALTSLHDIPETDETREQIEQLKFEIADIRRRLAEARGSQSRAIKREQSSLNPSAMSSPGGSRAGTPSFRRKRSFASSHFDGSATGRLDSKTRKPTPAGGLHFSSDDDPFGGLPVIDLTEEDDTTWQEVLRSQKEEAERLRRNKALADSDRVVAESLAAQPGPSQSGATSFFGQNAFDRIRDHSGLPTKREPAWVSSSSSRSGATSMPLVSRPGPSRPDPEFPFSFGSSNIKPEFRPANSSYVKPESSSSLGPGVKPESRSSSGTPNVHVPGAWDSSDDDFDGFGAGSGAFLSLDPASHLTRFPPPPSLTLPQPPAAPGHLATHQFGVPSTMSTIEHARQLALASQTAGMVYPQYGADLVDLTSSSSGYNTPHSASYARPGFLSGGSYFSTALPTFGSLSSSLGSSLGSVINRVKSYDWDNFLDAHGDPLDSRLMGYVQDYVEDPRKTAEEIQNLLSNIRPDMDIPAEERGETPEALKYPLYPHQQLALKWMTDMETGTNKGGILADDMGLGKTISALALMVSRRSIDSVKTNLIIGPVALIRQWELEIKKKIKGSHKLSVYLSHQKKKISYQQMKNYDVVLTTYGSVASEWKQFTIHTEQRKGGEGYEPARDEELQRKCPLLHPKSRFYRVILDEAQCIKNKDTQGSKAAHLINATYRWCLTGTPMMNGVPELFPLIRFLRIKPYCHQKQFTEAFKGLTPKAKVTENQKNDSLRKLQAVLKAIMLRRMKTSQIDGKPILTLPAKTQLEEYVVFSEDELKFYQDLEARSQVQFNKYLRQGTVGKNYSNILVLLLRLRQACCHPHLMDFECVGANNLSEDQMVTLAKSLESTVVERIKAVEAFECPICYDAVDDPTLIIPCGHDTCSECFTSLTDTAAQGNIRSGNEGGVNPKCPVCRGPVEPTKTIKYTVFQKAHMPESLPALTAATSAVELGSETDTDSDTDSDSDLDDDDDDTGSIGSLEDFVVPDDEAEDEDEVKEDDDADIEAELVAAAEARKARKARKAEMAAKKQLKQASFRKPKKEKVQVHQLGALRQEAGKNKEARRRYMHYLRDNWEDSAKVTQVVELLKKIQDSDEKTIIFSQWTSLLDLIECQVKYKLGLKYCRYTGAMSRHQRDEAVEDFVKNPRNTVMLVSLRAGNAGLNLTVASRIIICDPFWNPYIEMQAIDRAHRIGQQREVTVHRILVKETVEDRILALQEGKRQLVEAALDEGQMKNLGRLSENELRYLFGVQGASGGR